MAKANSISEDKNLISGEITRAKSNKVIVLSDMDPDDVLDLDSKGKELLFDGRSDFVQLSDEIVSKLSKDNKLRYNFAREFHDSWRDADGVAPEGFTVDRQNTGTATQKLEYKLPKGMRARWTRPELVASRMTRGYKVVHQEGKTYVGEQNGTHKVTNLGRDELILMSIPEAQYKKNQEKNALANAKRAGLYRESFKNEAERVGVDSYDETTDKKDRRWNEQESLED